NRHDRVSAPVVPVRARDRRHVRTQRRLPAAPARSSRFRRALSAARGPGAGGAANAHVELAIPALATRLLNGRQAERFGPIRLSDRGGKPAGLALQAFASALRTSK